MKVKMYIVKDEVYPCYGILNPDDFDLKSIMPLIDITDEEFEWIKSVNSEYYKVQEFLKNKYATAKY